MNRRRAAGFTLVELLVCFVLVALATSLVVGGIGQGSATLARVGADQGAVYDELMARAWLRQTIAAAAGAATRGASFKGEAANLRLTSLRPLLGSEGMPTELSWQAGRSALGYTEGDQSFSIDSLPPFLRFEYQDAQGDWHEAWPPEKAQGLPARVRVVFADADDRLDVRVLSGSTGGDGSNDTALDRE